MLTVDQMIDLEIRIGEEIDRLREEMEDSGAERESVAPDNAIGRLSRLDSMQMQELAKAAHVRREERLVLLEAAAQRIIDGEYGVCQRCGGDLAWTRLDVQPEATHCAACVR